MNFKIHYILNNVLFQFLARTFFVLITLHLVGNLMDCLDIEEIAFVACIHGRPIMTLTLLLLTLIHDENNHLPLNKALSDNHQCSTKLYKLHCRFYGCSF